MTSKIVCFQIQWCNVHIQFKYQVNRMKNDDFRNLKKLFLDLNVINQNQEMFDWDWSSLSPKKYYRIWNVLEHSMIDQCQSRKRWLPLYGLQVLFTIFYSPCWGVTQAANLWSHAGFLSKGAVTPWRFSQRMQTYRKIHFTEQEKNLWASYKFSMENALLSK